MHLDHPQAAIFANKHKLFQLMFQNNFNFVLKSDVHVWKKKLNFSNFHLRFKKNQVFFQDKNVAWRLLSPELDIDQPISLSHLFQ